MIQLTFDPRVRLIRLRATLVGARPRSATLVLDTGASLTVLTPRAVAALDAPVVPEAPDMPILTAGGRANTAQHHLASLDLYGERLGPVRVLSAPLPLQIRAEGLLGLDVLRHFNVTLDFEHGELTLERFPTDRVKETIATYSAPPARAA